MNTSDLIINQTINLKIIEVSFGMTSENLNIAIAIECSSSLREIYNSLIEVFSTETTMA